ncbi:MAG: maleylacetoacetate isomerase [Steroidobacteraceae bacterium]
MKLYHFAPSSASLRVRIALAWKGIDYERVSVSLAEGAHREDAYRALQPQQLVPALQLDDGRVMVQSLPIIEYLEEQYPAPALLPKDPWQRSYVRAIAQMVACEIHPLNNMRVAKFLRDPLGLSQEAVNGVWAHHWLQEGFDAIEAFLKREALHGEYCLADQFTLADICLLAQVAGAARFNFDTKPYPLLAGIAERGERLDAVRKARSTN